MASPPKNVQQGCILQESEAHASQWQPKGGIESVIQPLEQPSYSVQPTYPGPSQNFHPSLEGFRAAALWDTSPGTGSLPIIASLPNPDSSTACLYTASQRASSLHCSTIGITASSFFADDLYNLTHWYNLLIQPQVKGSLLIQCNFQFSHLFQTREYIGSKQLTLCNLWNSPLTRYYLYSMPLIQDKLITPSRQLNRQPL